MVPPKNVALLFLNFDSFISIIAFSRIFSPVISNIPPLRFAILLLNSVPDIYNLPSQLLK